MVSNLTIGKEKYSAVQDDISELLEKSERLRVSLTGLLEEDVEAYTRLSQTMKMPSGPPSALRTTIRAVVKPSP